MFARLMGLKTISPTALHELIQQEAVSVIDVNPDQAWIKAHVPGATFVLAAAMLVGAAAIAWQATRQRD